MFFSYPEIMTCLFNILIPFSSLLKVFRKRFKERLISYHFSGQCPGEQKELSLYIQPRLRPRQQVFLFGQVR